MKALVKESAAPGFKLKDVAEPRIREDEVLIRVRRAGVCGTDVHIYDWDAWAKGRCKPPFVVGHEFAGDVIQVGRLVTDVKEGIASPLKATSDGRCLLCRTGNAHVCPFTKSSRRSHGCFAECYPRCRRPPSGIPMTIVRCRYPRSNGERVPYRAHRRHPGAVVLSRVAARSESSQSGFAGRRAQRESSRPISTTRGWRWQRAWGPMTLCIRMRSRE